MNLLVSARRPDLVIVNKKIENLPNCLFCRHSRPQSKIERKQKEIYVLRTSWRPKINYGT